MTEWYDIFSYWHDDLDIRILDSGAVLVTLSGHAWEITERISDTGSMLLSMSLADPTAPASAAAAGYGDATTVPADVGAAAPAFELDLKVGVEAASAALLVQNALTAWTDFLF